jgi:hypothetical protein
MSLKRIWACLLLICAFQTACKSNHSADKDKQLPKSLQGEWYKRYAGTVNGAPVVVHLHHYASGIIGFYYYDHKSVVIDLTESADSADSYNVHLKEFVRTSRAADEENYTPDRWAINITDKEITGTWTSGNNLKAYDIKLKEDYTENSYPLTLMAHADSASEKKGMTTTEAVSAYELLQPAPEMKSADADFIKTSVMQICGGDTLKAANLSDYIKKEDKKYFSNYKKLLQDVNIDRDNSEDWQYNFYHSRNMWVLYNQGGLISVELHEYDYSGGGSGHGNTWSSYACIDVQQKKIWRLDDMINVDGAELLPILDDEIRHIYKLSKKDKLGEHLITDNIPLTQNVFVTDIGMTFCYNPMEIGSESDGEICVFIPYARMGKMLKADFKNRMGLK